jgi:hypothetical protein
VLLDPDRARRLGDGAQQRVRAQFLPDRYLSHWAKLLETLPSGMNDPAAWTAITRASAGRG